MLLDFYNHQEKGKKEFGCCLKFWRKMKQNSVFKENNCWIGDATGKEKKIGKDSNFSSCNDLFKKGKV